MRSGAQTDGGDTPCSRGQTETLGFVLVIALVLLGSALVVGLGAVAVGDTEERLAADRAEKALTQFDSKAALVAVGSSDSHAVSFGTGAADHDQLAVEPDAGWMRVTITDRTNGTTDEVLNITSLGAVVYDGDDARLAYQGGGVWRADRRGGQMISPPEFHYRGETLTLPAITITGESHLNEEATIERVDTTRAFPNESRGGIFRNPIRNGIVNVTVGSEFYRGWAKYFEKRTEGEVAVDDENETAELTLVSPVGDITAESIVAGHAASGTLNFQANPSHPCHKGGNPKPPYVDSYNSSQLSGSETYCDQYDENEVNSAGDIAFAGDISTQAAAGQLQADLVSGGEVDLFHNMDLHGNVSYTDSCSDCETAQADSRYEVEEIGGVEPSPPIDFAIESIVESTHQFGEHVTLGDGETDHLDAGEYYTDEIALSGDTVTFDTTDGDISLVVNRTIDLSAGANITAEGGGQVNIYVDGSDGEDDLSIEGHDTEIFAPNNNASKVTILGRQDFTASLDGGDYTGVIYAPAGTDGSGGIEIFGDGTLYGAMVTGDLTIGKAGKGGGGAGGTLHYDRALQDQQIVPPNQSIIRLTFLHVTETEIAVSG